MKNLFLILLAAFSLTACEKKTNTNSDSSDNPQNQEIIQTPSRIDIYPSFTSQFVPARAIRVYVPANYDSTAHYDRSVYARWDHAL